MTLLENLTTAEDKALSTLKDVQGTVLDYTKKATEAVAPRIPELNLPGNFEVKPTDAVSYVTNVFEFAGKVLEAQKGFVVAMIETVGGLVEKAPVAPAKPAAKKAASAA